MSPPVVMVMCGYATIIQNRPCPWNSVVWFQWLSVRCLLSMSYYITRFHFVKGHLCKYFIMSCIWPHASHLLYLIASKVPRLTRLMVNTSCVFYSFPFLYIHICWLHLSFCVSTWVGVVKFVYGCVVEQKIALYAVWDIDVRDNTLVDVTYHVLEYNFI